MLFADLVFETRGQVERLDRAIPGDWRLELSLHRFNVALEVVALQVPRRTPDTQPHVRLILEVDLDRFYYTLVRGTDRNFVVSIDDLRFADSLLERQDFGPKPIARWQVCSQVHSSFRFFFRFQGDIGRRVDIVVKNHFL